MSTGTVVAFDEHVGLGEVEDDSGSRWPFHCVEITDGSRRIAVGTPVEFRVVPKVGRFEAVAVRPIP